MLSANYNWKGPICSVKNRRNCWNGDDEFNALSCLENEETCCQMTEAVVLAIPKVLNTVCLGEGGKFTTRFVASLSPLLFF